MMGIEGRTSGEFVLSAPSGIGSALFQNATRACDSERRQVEVSWGAARFIVFPRRTFTLS